MKISVITVCYNSAATIRDTLESVNAQTHAEVEHVIVDGGSTDQTLPLVAAHALRAGPRLSGRDKGIYDAMNKGVAAATGDVIGLINSDDFYASPQVLARVAEVFADPTVDACWGDLCYVGQENTAQIVRYWRSGPFVKGSFHRGWAPPHPTVFLRREVYARCGLFDLAYPIAADLELMARLFEVHGVRGVHLPFVMVKMRMGGTTNRSLKNIVLQNREIWRALKQHGLHPSLPTFVLGKLVARAKQFLTRPAAA